MTSGGARRGRRDNGLIAAAYAAVGDVDPRVGEHLLDVLALRGIAAYLQPATDLHPVTRTTTLPSRPTDRLFVDSDHLDTARDFLAQLGPESAPKSATAVDEIFAGIVAGFDAEVVTATWPAAEDLSDQPAAEDLSDQPAAEDPPGDRPPGDRLPGDQPSDRPGEPIPGSPPVILPRWSGSTVTPTGDPRGGGPSLLDGLDDPGTDDDDEDDYTPPPPPPLPRFSPVIICAVLAVLAGVALLFRPDLLPLDSTLTVLLGVCGVVGGFVTLVWRLRPGDDDDDWDPDNGAVV